MRTIRAGAAGLLALLAAAAAPCAFAQAATSLSLAVISGGASFPYGAPPSLRATLAFPVASCPSSIDPPQATLRVTIDGRFGTAFPVLIEPGSCAAGTRVFNAVFDLPADLPIGDFVVRASFGGTAPLQPSQSAPIAIAVLPTVTLAAPGGGALEVGTRGPACTSQAFEARGGNAHGPATPGGDIRLPYGVIAYDFAACSVPGPVSPTLNLVHRIALRYPAVIPPGSSVWRFAAPTATESPRWTLLPATFDGRNVIFDLPSPDDETGTLPQSKSGLLAVVQEHPYPPHPPAHGMWWGGPEENGWGLAIEQDGDKAFFVLYVYDTDGRAVWFVLSDGAWDPANSSYVGFMYRTDGSFFGDYYGVDFRANAPIGLASLQFTGQRLDTVTYRLEGHDGFKTLRPFRSTPAPAGPRTGLWWGGEYQDGWGIYLSEEAGKLFAAWYTYDLQGKPTWFVVSDAQPTANGYAGVAYRTQGAPWLGVTYEPSRLAVTPVGAIDFTFSAPDRGTMSFDIEGNRKVQPIERFRLR